MIVHEKSVQSFWEATPREIMHRFWFLEQERLKSKEPAKGDEAIRQLRSLISK